jgi:methyl-accepting chemotaxis protein
VETTNEEFTEKLKSFSHKASELRDDFSMHKDTMGALIEALKTEIKQLSKQRKRDKSSFSNKLAQIKQMVEAINTQRQDSTESTTIFTDLFSSICEILRI